MLKIMAMVMIMVLMNLQPDDADNIIIGDDDGSFVCIPFLTRTLLKRKSFYNFISEMFFLFV